MKKSKLLKDPRLVARIRLAEQFNLHPRGNGDQRCTAFHRFGEPEMARLALTALPATTVVGWRQDGDELMVLYRNGGAMVLLDRYFNKSTDALDTVFGVAAARLDEMERLLDLLQDTQPPIMDLDAFDCQRDGGAKS